MEPVKYGARLKYWAWLIVAVVMLFASKCSYAQNTGFETGSLTGWTYSSGVSVSTGTGNVSYGGGLNWNISPYGSYMAQVFTSGSVTFDSAISSLGLSGTEGTAIKNYMIAQSQVSGGSPNPTNASWIKKTVTLQAGVSYSFAWNYLSTDYMPFNDGSLISLTHTTDANVKPTLNNLQQRYGLLGFTNTGTGEYSTGSYGSTGWQVATFTVPVDGDYVLGFTAFNLGDTILSPMLFIDELQGLTTKNGQPFTPVEPNPGSSAPPAQPAGPTYCCGGTDAAFNANTGFASRASSWGQQGGNRVIIEQIGHYNTTTVTQQGNKNYVELHVNGSNNTHSVTQTGTTTNYIESTVAGSNNSITYQQTSSGGAKGILLNSTNDGNTVSVQQQDGGNHYAEITLSGGSKTVNITQQGSAGHMAKIELSGGATEINTTQTGSTQQFYSITHSCATASCSAITVTQGQ